LTTLLQVSDTHFGTERMPVVDALVRLSKALSPDVLVMSGDITQRARPAQFAAARAFIDRLRVPYRLVMPGNHDIPLFNLPARLFAPFSNHRKVFGDNLEPTFEADDMLVITVNTTRRLRHENGAVSAAQIERVAKQLEHAGREQVRVVVTHQPVAVTKPEDRKTLLKGHRDAVFAWSEAGADLVLGGHIHLPFIVPLHRRYDNLPHTVWAVQAGSAVSARLRRGAANSVNVIRPAGLAYGRRSVSVERWDFDDKTLRFECVSIEDLNEYSTGPMPFQ